MLISRVGQLRNRQPANLTDQFCNDLIDIPAVSNGIDNDYFVLYDYIKEKGGGVELCLTV